MVVLCPNGNGPVSGSPPFKCVAISSSYSSSSVCLCFCFFLGGWGVFCFPCAGDDIGTFFVDLGGSFFFRGGSSLDLQTMAT